MCELQQGTTFELDDDDLTFGVISCSRFSAPIPVIDDTDLETEDSRQKCAGQLADPQMITLVCRSLGREAYPTRGLYQDLTITHALNDGDSAPEILDGEGFVVDVRTPEFSSDTEDRKTIEIDWQYRAVPTRTESTPSALPP